jgi:hypothetical protein
MHPSFQVQKNNVGCQSKRSKILNIIPKRWIFCLNRCILIIIKWCILWTLSRRIAEMYGSYKYHKSWYESYDFLPFCGYKKERKKVDINLWLLENALWIHILLKIYILWNTYAAYNLCIQVYPPELESIFVSIGFIDEVGIYLPTLNPTHRQEPNRQQQNQRVITT